MPTYEYECEKCGYHFEEFQSITKKPLETCQKKDCKGKVHRVISPGAGFIFKGSGFYTTDYRSDSYKKAAEAEKPSSSVSTKSETKKTTASKTNGKKPASPKKD